MKEPVILIIALAALALPAGNTMGQETPEQAAAEAKAARAEAEATRAEAEVAATRVLEEAEIARAEAENARREAERVAERASEAVRARDESHRAARAARSEAAERERSAQQAEIEQAREELSRAHRELREAQREVARAHRELSSNASHGYAWRTANLGDKPVIGIVMGEEVNEGLELVGVSPDGPADEAGVEVGDVLVAINGKRLDRPEEARAIVFSTMETVKPGDTVVLGLVRDGKPLDVAVVAEVREPTSWQSLVRIPEIETVRRIEGDPGKTHIVIESTIVPEIDTEALAERMELLRENLADREWQVVGEDLHFAPNVEFDELEGNYSFELKDYSDFADHAFTTANVSFGLPRAQGLKLATVNEGLGAYFKTDHGVLVLEAKEDNAYRLEAGDVIIKIGENDVKAPSDLVRALRDVEPGDEVEIEIKRDRRNKTLKVTVPENRFGLR